jgi:hypothetical protein
MDTVTPSLLSMTAAVLFGSGQKWDVTCVTEACYVRGKLEFFDHFDAAAYNH